MNDPDLYKFQLFSGSSKENARPMGGILFLSGSTAVSQEGLTIGNSMIKYFVNTQNLAGCLVELVVSEELSIGPHGLNIPPYVYRVELSQLDKPND